MYEKLTTHANTFRKFLRDHDGIVEFETVPEIEPPMKNQFGLAIASIVAVPFATLGAIYTFAKLVL